MYQKKNFKIYSGKTLAAMLGASLLCSASALALDPLVTPQGENVVAGGADFDRPADGQLDIHQNTDRVIIDWDSFNIGKDAKTEFFQPGSDSIAVNRVKSFGHDPSQIMGTLKANGQVMILDLNGVIFGKDSVVDVGGIIASTGNIDDVAFMRGDNILDIADIDKDGAIINHGDITAADAGLVAFVAPMVENSGVIRARTGRVELAAGSKATVDLYGDKLIELAVDETLERAIVTNTGRLMAEGGVIHLTARAAKGIVDSTINMGGVGDVSSAMQLGGTIILEADHVSVSGTLDASGQAGGGAILVGGDYQGQGDVYTAETTTVTETATLKANAYETGNGGKVIVWSDGDTIVGARIEAKGGVISGDGGFVETSGKNKLKVHSDARIDVSAPNGKGGDWLLDPTDITITDGGGDVDTATINATLNGGGNVTVTTAGAGVGTGIITLTNATINKSVANNDATLTLLANEDIVVSNTTLTSTSGDALNVVLNADLDANQSGYISMTNSSFTTNGGNFTAGGGADPATTAAWGNAAGDDGVVLTTTDIITGAGDISLRGHGRNDAAGSSQYGVYVRTGSKLQTTTGNITIDGVGGNGIGSNYGFLLSAAGTLVTSVSGAIDITGQGGSNGTAASDSNIGIYVLDSADITSTGTGTNAATITLDGTGGAGDDNNYGIILNSSALVTSVDGAISLIGQGGSNGMAGSNINYGIYLANGADITSTGTGIGASTITLDGTGANGEDSNSGVVISSSGTEITSVDGAIDITGQGGSTGVAGSNNNYGIYLVNASDIASTGVGTNAATITLDGTGGAGEDDNYGIYLVDAGTEITSVDGAIDITALGGSNGTNGSNLNQGIYMRLGADITSTGTGANAATITLDGTGGNGLSLNYGVHLTGAGTLISSVEGAIDITGSGGSKGTDVSQSNYGIYLLDSADITSTGTGTNAATIALDGTGGAGGSANIGVRMEGGNTLVTSIDGAIDITGRGGSGGAAVSNNNYGIHLFSDADITSTGTGAGAAAITLDGTGGNGGDGNIGVHLSDTGTLITSVDGAIDIIGQGGSRGLAGSDSNYGVYLVNGSDVTSTGTGAHAATITLNGIGGAGEDSNNGVRLENSGTLITSVDGAIEIIGTGGNNGIAGSDFNYGILLNTGADVISTGVGVNAATITLNGTGGNGSGSNRGVYMNAAGTTVTSAEGDISLTGRGRGTGAGNDDIEINAASVTTTAASTDITLIANTLDLLSGPTLSATGNFTIGPRSFGTSIGLGGGAGTLNLTDAYLALLSVGGRLQIGNSNSGLVTIDSVDVSPGGYDLRILGGGIGVNSGLTGAGSVELISTNNLNLNSGTVTAAGTGITLVLAAANNFVNNVGPAALDNGLGRTVIYSALPSTIQKGGLSGPELYGRSYATHPPALIPGAADVTFVYALEADALLGGNTNHNMTNHPSQNSDTPSGPAFKQYEGLIEEEVRRQAGESSEGDGAHSGENENSEPSGDGCLVELSETGNCALN